MNTLNMLKTTLPLTLALVTGAPPMIAAAQAQAPITAQAQVDHRMARLQERLALTKDQQPKVRCIQSAHMSRMAALLSELRKQTARRDRRAILRQIQALRGETSARMSAVLSRPQMTAYEAFLAEQEKEMRQRLKDRRAAHADGDPLAGAPSSTAQDPLITA